jgi:hypothetical protein
LNLEVIIGSGKGVLRDLWWWENFSRLWFLGSNFERKMMVLGYWSLCKVYE